MQSRYLLLALPYEASAGLDSFMRSEASNSRHAMMYEVLPHLLNPLKTAPTSTLGRTEVQATHDAGLQEKSSLPWNGKESSASSPVSKELAQDQGIRTAATGPLETQDLRVRKRKRYDDTPIRKSARLRKEQATT